MVDTPPRQPFRRRAILLAIAGSLIGLVVAGPWLLTPFVRAKLLAGIERELAVRASVEHLSWEWSGHVELRGLQLERLDQAPVASIGVAEADVSIASLFAGAPDVDLQAEGFQLWARRDRTGAWDLAGLAREHEKEPSGEADEPEGARDPEAPGPRVSLRLRAGRLHLETGGRTTRLDRIAGSLSFATDPATDGWTLEVEELTATGRDGEGGEGSLKLGGTAASRPGGPRFAGRLSTDRLPLAMFDPFLGEVHGIRTVKGRLSGRGAILWEEGRLVDLDGEWVSEGTALRGSRDPLAELGKVELSLSDAAEGPGWRPQARLVLGDVGKAQLAFETDVLPEGRATLEFEAQAAGLGRALGAWLPVREGATWLGSASGSLKLGSRFEALRPVALDGSGKLAWTKFGLIDADGTRVDLEPLTAGSVELALEADLETPRLRLEKTDIRSGPMELLVTGELAGLVGSKPLEGTLDVRTSLDLGGLQTALARMVDLGGRRVSGKLAGTLTAGSSPDPDGASLLEVDGTLEGSGIRIVDPREEGRSMELALVRVGLDAHYDSLADALGIESLTLESDVLEGRFSGAVNRLASYVSGPSDAELELEDISGSGTYVPERLARLLGPALPFDLRGAEPEPFSLRLAARTPSLDPVALATHASGMASVRLGRLLLGELPTTGDLSLTLEGGQVFWNGDLEASGGRLVLQGDLGVGEGSRGPSLRIESKQVGVTRELTPLLARIHPAFALTGDVAKGVLSGIVTGDLELQFRGEWSPHLLHLSWRDFPKELLTGRGRLELGQLRISGSKLLEPVADLLDLSSDKGVDVRPIDFRLESGRLTYDRPWEWEIDGVPTRFSGSVGLDGALDLVWMLPVGAELVRGAEVLAPLQGSVLRVPIRGTVDSPKIDLLTALEDQGFGTVARALEAGNPLEILNELPHLEAGGDPADLLREADRLWDAGEKVEAAALYRRLRSDYSISLVYLLHRDRIKKRGKYQE